MRLTVIITLSFLLVILVTGQANAQMLSVNSLEFGLSGGMFQLQGDGNAGSPGLQTIAFIKKPFGNHFSVALMGGMAKQTFGEQETSITTDFTSVSLAAFYELMPFSFLNPFVSVSGGGLNFSVDGSPRYWDGDAAIGGGAFLKLFGPLKLMLSAGYHFTTGDDFEGLRDNRPDTYFSAQAGLSFAFTKTSGYQLRQPRNRIAIEEQAPASAQKQPLSFVDQKKQEKYLRLLQQRLSELQSELSLYSTVEGELRKAIRTRDQVIKDLETQLTEGKKQKKNK